MKRSLTRLLVVALAASNTSCARMWWRLHYSYAKCYWTEMPELEVTKTSVLPRSNKSKSNLVIPVHFLLRRDDYMIEFRNGEGLGNHYLYIQAKGPSGEPLALRSPQFYGGLNGPPWREIYRYSVDAESVEVLELTVRDSMSRELGRESLKLVALSGGRCVVYN